MYGAGLRVGEGRSLRVMDIDFDRRQMLVRGGKGDKDRAVPLPASRVERLRGHLWRLREQHERDCRKSADWG